MKLLLATLIVLPLAVLASASSVAPTRSPAPAPVDDPPPIECPFCGGNVQLHAAVVNAITTTQARIARIALVAFQQ